MPTLLWTISATIVGAALSVLAAAAFALRASPARIPMLISYAIGALLGAVFLEVLPHALERAGNVKRYLYETHQVPLHKISIISYGEDKPVGDNKTKDGRAQNRRVVIKVLA